MTQNKQQLYYDVQRLKQSELFDKEYYETYNSDVMRSKFATKSIEHFLLHGWKEGRNPSACFDMFRYIFDPTNGYHVEDGNPIFHYMDNKLNKTIYSAIAPRSVPYSYYSEYLMTPSVDISKLPEEKSVYAFKILIIVHFYYIEQFEAIASYLNNLPCSFDLAITVTSLEHKATALEFKTCCPRCGSVSIYCSNNIGRDIGPFLVGAARQTLNYDLVCKIHTKQKPRAPYKPHWGKGLIDNLLGSPEIIEACLQAFQQDTTLGIIYPMPPSETRMNLKNNDSYGSMKKKIQNLAAALCISLPENNYFLFPAGSMFWFRPKALRQMLTASWKYENFDTIVHKDGDLIHSAERLLGLTALHNGYKVKNCAFVPYEYNYNTTDRQQLDTLSHEVQISMYRKKLKKHKTTLVYTCLVGGYDVLTIPEVLHDHVDYICYTDMPERIPFPWRALPLQYCENNITKIARYHKTHPFISGSYQHYVWIDANILIRSNIVSRATDALDASGADTAWCPHPERTSFHEEMQTCVASKRDLESIIHKQIHRYKAINLPASLPLPETNFFVTRKTKTTEAFFDTWWQEIQQFSQRDQLSVNYAMFVNKINPCFLFTQYEQTPRYNLSDFIYYMHNRHANNIFYTTYNPFSSGKENL